MAPAGSPPTRPEIGWSVSVEFRHVGQHVARRAGAAKAPAESFPAVAVVGLDAGQTPRDACAAAGVDPEADRAVIGLPLYAMSPGVALKLRPLLPVR